MIPTLHDGVVVLNRYTSDDIAAHLAGEDEETARRFGWWPKTSTPATVRDAFTRWAHDWETGGPTRTFAARDQATGRLLGGCELRIKPGWPANVSYWTNATDRGRGYASRSWPCSCTTPGQSGSAMPKRASPQTTAHPAGSRKKPISSWQIPTPTKTALA